MHFLEKLSNLIYEEIDKLHKVIAIKIFEFVVKILPPQHTHTEDVGSSQMSLVRANLYC